LNFSLLISEQTYFPFVKFFVAPCVVPHIQQSSLVLLTHSSNRSVVDSTHVVQHGEKLIVECEASYEFLAGNNTPVECDNGTWTHIPTCEPGMTRITVWHISQYMSEYISELWIQTLFYCNIRHHEIIWCFVNPQLTRKTYVRKCWNVVISDRISIFKNF
jgi:hypothetical protein